MPTAPAHHPAKAAPRWRWATAAGVAVVALVAVGVFVSRPGDTTHRPMVLAGDHSCQMSGHPHPGRQMLDVADVGASATEVAVFGYGPTVTVQYGEIEDLGPGTTVAMPVDLGPGTYTLVCEPGRSDENPITSSFVTTGSGPPPTGIVPATNDDFTAPVHDYKEYVAVQLADLSQDLVGLRSLVAQGNRAGAEADYPVVHANYERIGAVYDAFGDSDTAINGLADGLPRGEADPSFTGFHKLEAELWGNASTADLLVTVDGLSAAVAHLSTVLPLVVIDSLTYATRAHEILENALQEQVTGLTEPHSHTGIDDTAASATGAAEVVATLRSLIQRQDPALVPHIDAGFSRLESVLTQLRANQGAYRGDDALSVGQREQLTAAISSLLEDLAQVPGLITPAHEPRDTSEH